MRQLLSCHRPVGVWTDVVGHGVVLVDLLVLVITPIPQHHQSGYLQLQTNILFVHRRERFERLAELFNISIFPKS